LEGKLEDQTSVKIYQDAADQACNTLSCSSSLLVTSQYVEVHVHMHIHPKKFKH